MKNLTPFIDDDGNMHLHTREGGLATLDFQEDDGSPRDMTGASLFFEVEGFRKALSAGENASQMILLIERGELNQFRDKVSNYIIIDETGEVPHVLIEGKVIVSGWV